MQIFQPVMYSKEDYTCDFLYANKFDLFYNVGKNIFFFSLVIFVDRGQ